MKSPDEESIWLLVLAFIAVLLGWFFVIAWVSNAFAHDMQHPDQDEWYASLFMPDSPTVSCCGGKDAYFADETDECKPGIDVVINNGWNNECALVAIITDTRKIEGRYPYLVGTRIAVPKSKLRKVGSNNPTDHAVVFVAPISKQVYCYEPMTML